MIGEPTSKLYGGFLSTCIGILQEVWDGFCPQKIFSELNLLTLNSIDVFSFLIFRRSDLTITAAFSLSWSCILASNFSSFLCNCATFLDCTKLTVRFPVIGSNAARPWSPKVYTSTRYPVIELFCGMLQPIWIPQPSDHSSMERDTGRGGRLESKPIVISSENWPDPPHSLFVALNLNL